MNYRDRVNIDVRVGKSLFDPGPLDVMQAVLIHLAPKWTSGLHVWRYRRSQSTPIDVMQPQVLFHAATTRALERGPVWKKLREADGAAEGTFRSGSAEIRGANRSIVLVLLMGDLSTWDLFNHATLQLLGRRIEGQPLFQWARRALEDLSMQMAPEYARNFAREEFDAKNMDLSYGQRAIGPKDYSLPGLYWCNFLGAPYCDLIGRDRLLSAPAYEVKEVGAGVLLTLAEKPEEWKTPEYKAREQRVLDHIGREYVWERDHPDKPTKSPFKLPPTPPHDPSVDIKVLHKGGGQYEVLNPDLRAKLGLPGIWWNSSS